jgi:hypothetical protein
VGPGALEPDAMEPYTGEHDVVEPDARSWHLFLDL